MSRVLFLTSSILVAIASAQMKICEDENSIVLPSIKGSCPHNYVLLTNWACAEKKCVETVPCADKTDAHGKSLCPITKDKCGFEYLSWSSEPKLCAKTCGYCSAPGECIDFRSQSGEEDCILNAGDCNSADEHIRHYTRKLCPKTCGVCK